MGHRVIDKKKSQSKKLSSQIGKRAFYYENMNIGFDLGFDV
jgi:hypothetical protein